MVTITGHIIAHKYSKIIGDLGFDSHCTGQTYSTLQTFWPSQGLGKKGRTSANGGMREAGWHENGL